MGILTFGKSPMLVKDTRFIFGLVLFGRCLCPDAVVNNLTGGGSISR